MPDVAGQNILRTILVEGVAPMSKAEDQFRVQNREQEHKANR